MLSFASTAKSDDDILPGVRGWLLVFAVLLIPHLLLSAANGFGSWRVLSVSGEMSRVEWIRLGLAATMFAGNGFGLFLIATRHRYAPAFFSIYLALTVPLIFVDPDLFATQVVQLQRLGFGARAATHTRPETVAGVALSIGVSLVWVAYWFRSRRVREVFGSTGVEALRS